MGKLKNLKNPHNRILEPDERAELIAALETSALNPTLSPEVRALRAKRAEQMRKIQKRRTN